MIGELIAGCFRGYWSFNDNAGNTTVTDSTSLSNNLTSARNTSAMTSASGIRGRCFDLIAGSDSLSRADNDFNFTTACFTVGCWARPDTFSNSPRDLIYFGDKSSGGWRAYIDTTGDPSFKTYQAAASQLTTGCALTAEEWTHVVLVRDGASAVWYMNGVRRSGSAGSHTDPDTAAGSSLWVGTDSTGSGNYDGRIDEFFVVEEALSSHLVEAMYLMGWRASESGGSARSNLYGSASQVKGVSIYGNLAFVGTGSSGSGAVSFIDLRGSYRIDEMDASSGDSDDSGCSFDFDDVVSLHYQDPFIAIAGNTDTGTARVWIQEVFL